MWHGCVEDHSAPVPVVGVGIAPDLSGWQTKDIYLDELERQIPVEVRRNRPGAREGQPPPDRTVKKLEAQPLKRSLADISGSQDGA
eukprot:CAMPEP_0168482656 /NCGR_PEP_ID=MMETSP0228-20121227/65148_1 /TAXON_ID=133427 /ORGANISM="Protoceratium reticulatum, Strain CCCM 535 (=CCMP 1889)" /LENGTH=85 /DNA_ID=CAMNT_0008499079 /DNA_START=51 /DNA_END=304 /DNA_ORIENTATION=-